METKIGAEKIEWRDVDGLEPYARNARMHSDQQVADIAASIGRFGFNNPVLVDGGGGIIAGHGRVLAAKRLGMERVPVVELIHLNEDERRAYILADNKLAEKAGWDQDLLRLELGELRDLDFDLAGFGFSDKELSKLLPGEPDPEPQAGAEKEDNDQFGVIVICRDETHQEEVFNELAGAGHQCKVVTV